jgi:hypothetical protein
MDQKSNSAHSTYDATKIRPVKICRLFFFCRLGSGARAEFPDSLFQLGAFADVCDLFACCGEFAFLFGRTGNFVRGAKVVAIIRWRSGA